MERIPRNPDTAEDAPPSLSSSRMVLSGLTITTAASLRFNGDDDDDDDDEDYDDDNDGESSRNPNDEASHEGDHISTSMYTSNFLERAGDEEFGSSARLATPGISEQDEDPSAVPSPDEIRSIAGEDDSYSGSEQDEIDGGASAAMASENGLTNCDDSDDGGAYADVEEHGEDHDDDGIGDVDGRDHDGINETDDEDVGQRRHAMLLASTGGHHFRDGGDLGPSVEDAEIGAFPPPQNPPLPPPRLPPPSQPPPTPPPLQPEPRASSVHTRSGRLPHRGPRPPSPSSSSLRSRGGYRSATPSLGPSRSPSPHSRRASRSPSPASLRLRRSTRGGDLARPSWAEPLSAGTVRPKQGCASVNTMLVHDASTALAQQTRVATKPLACWNGDPSSTPNS